MNFEKISFSEMPKGKYFIGDLSYILPEYIYHNIYDNYIENISDDDLIIKVTTNEGIDFLLYLGTTFDSDYMVKDNQGNSYKISSGIIGVVQLYDEKIIEKAKCFMADGISQVMEFEEEFSLSSEAGIFYFGNVVVDTTSYEDDGEGDDPWGGKNESDIFENSERDDKDWNWIN